jgi:hypothetical protein
MKAAEREEIGKRPASAWAWEYILELEQERDKLRAFAQAILDDWPDANWDGADLQDLALHHGLLATMEVTGPCDDECCICAKVGGFPATCYRSTPLLTTGRAE